MTEEERQNVKQGRWAEDKEMVWGRKRWRGWGDGCGVGGGEGGRGDEGWDGVGWHGTLIELYA